MSVTSKTNIIIWVDKILHALRHCWVDSASNRGWQAHLRHNPLGMLGKHLVEAPDSPGAMGRSGLLDAVVYNALCKDQPSSIRQADKAFWCVTRICMFATFSMLPCYSQKPQPESGDINSPFLPVKDSCLSVCRTGLHPRKIIHVNLDASSTTR